MTTTTSDDTDKTPQPTAAELGVGARLSLYPMTDDFVTVILDALDGVDDSGLEVRTDDVSTYLGATSVPGAVPKIARYVETVVRSTVSRTRGHVVAALLLSRGCPGEVTCEVGEDPLPAPEEVPLGLEPSGITAAAHWSVYPLDGDDHMDWIGRAIKGAEETGTFSRGEHYVTRLDGDLSEVIATIFSGWLAAGPGHVTTHATISVRSPTYREDEQ